MSNLRYCVCCEGRFAPPHKRCPACGILLLLSDAETAALVDATDEHNVGDDEVCIRKSRSTAGCMRMALVVIVAWWVW